MDAAHRVCTLSGLGLVFHACVCQSAERSPTLECPGGLACHNQRDRYGAKPDVRDRRDGVRVAAAAGGTYPALPITIVLDNARYQKCALVQELARSLGIELLYLPAYSPNLNLIERFWKWVKKQCLYGKYYPTSADFQAAIQQCIAQAHSGHLAELESLLTLKFQTFTEVLVLGEEAKVDSSAGENRNRRVYLFPKRKQAQKKVSSKAA